MKTKKHESEGILLGDVAGELIKFYILVGILYLAVPFVIGRLSTKITFIILLVALVFTVFYVPMKIKKAFNRVDKESQKDNVDVVAERFSDGEHNIHVQQFNENIDKKIPEKTYPRLNEHSKEVYQALTKYEATWSTYYTQIVRLKTAYKYETMYLSPYIPIFTTNDKKYFFDLISNLTTLIIALDDNFLIVNQKDVDTLMMNLQYIDRLIDNYSNTDDYKAYSIGKDSSNYRYKFNKLVTQATSQISSIIDDSKTNFNGDSKDVYRYLTEMEGKTNHE